VSKHRGSSRRRRRRVGLLIVAGLAAVAVMTGPSLARRAGFELSLPWGGSAAEACPATQVQITVTPELADAVAAVVEPLQGTELADGRCLKTSVTSQAAPATVLSAQTMPLDQAPQLWIPESSLWARQVEAWAFRTEGPLATSPLVIATSETVVGALGWAARPPVWADALSGVRPVAMPDLRNNASGVLAILGLWQSLDKTPAADQAVAAAVLASTRSTAPTPSSVIDKAVKNDPATPLLVTSELNVFTTNRGNPTSRLVAVYPRNGSPSLDYPILRVAPRLQGSSKSIATDQVVAALAGTTARELVRRSGLRDATGSAPVGAGVNTDTVAALDIPEPAEVTAFLQRLQALTRPSNLSVVIDVSLSMRAAVDGRLTRVQLAGQAAAAAGSLLSERSSVGLWIFSRNLPGLPENTDFQQLDQLLPIGQPEGGRSHGDVVTAHLLSLNARLGGDGTALYSTAVAALRSAIRGYDPAAVNSVVLFTDGGNYDPGGPDLAQTLSRLKSLANPDKPVRLIAIGIGPEADLAVLKQLVAPSKGSAYRATTQNELKTILFDALAHRSPDQTATATTGTS
jgi:Ca-activated chloride channel family protein